MTGIDRDTEDHRSGRTQPGRTEAAQATHPSGDNRFKMLDATMKRHQFQPDALIEVLHTAQELFGFLQTDLLHYIAHGLKLPPSRVYGVATFYHFFSFAPQGRAYVRRLHGHGLLRQGGGRPAGGRRAALRDRRRQDDAPTARSRCMTARCLGACGLAPVVVYDGQVAGNQAAGTRPWSA